MKRVLTILILLSPVCYTFSQTNNIHSDFELIVKFTNKVYPNLKNSSPTIQIGDSVLANLNKQFKLQNISGYIKSKSGEAFILKINAPMEKKQVIELYKSTGLFEYVEPNFKGKGGGIEGISDIFPDDTYFSRQYSLYNDGTFELESSKQDADIDMEMAWDIEQGDSTIVVAIIDAGVKLDHNELKGRIWKNYQEIPNNNIDDDNNGFIDDVEGWDFVNSDNDPTDDHGHGTNVAGIIGANGYNNIGYAGIDWNCKLMILKALDNTNQGYYTWWADAIHYAVDNGADIINMSMGGSDYSDLLKSAVDYAYNHNVAIVSCMMNDDNNTIYYPAGFQNAIAVGSTNSLDDRSSPFFWDINSGSNFGEHIDIVAPGSYIFGLYFQSNSNFNYYWSGTSQSAAIASGIGALLLAQDKSRTPDDIRLILRNSAEDQVGNTIEDVKGFDNYYGYGRVNAYMALTYTQTNINKPKYSAPEITLFPNPASEYIEISNCINGELKICNSLGKTVYEDFISNGAAGNRIDITALPEGLYIISFTDNESKTRITRKLLKK